MYLLTDLVHADDPFHQYRQKVNLLLTDANKSESIVAVTLASVVYRLAHLQQAQKWQVRLHVLLQCYAHLVLL